MRWLRSLNGCYDKYGTRGERGARGERCKKDKRNERGERGKRGQRVERGKCTHPEPSDRRQSRSNTRSPFELRACHTFLEKRQ
jgi:hypothetical protein